MFFFFFKLCYKVIQVTLSSHISLKQEITAYCRLYVLRILDEREILVIVNNSQGYFGGFTEQEPYRLNVEEFFS